MKAFTLLFLITLYIKPLLSQEEVTVRNENEKQGKWVYFGKDRPESKYPDSTKVSTTYYTNNQKNGYDTSYYNDGKRIKSIRLYKNDVPTGNFLNYWENGNLKSSGTLYRREFHDTLKRFYENGNIKSFEVYDKGVLKGNVFRYHDNGKLEYSASIANGRETFKTYYDKDGKLSSPFVSDCRYYSDTCFKNNKFNQYNEKGKQGHWIFFGKDFPGRGYPDSVKIEEGAFIDGMKEGIWIRFHSDGITPKIQGEFSKGRPVGPYSKGSGITRSRNPENNSLFVTPEYVAFYNSTGKEEGPVEYYYPNGQLEYFYTAINGNPVGRAYRYCENGDLKEITLYGENGEVNTEYFLEKGCDPIKIDSSKTATKILNPNTIGQEFKQNGYNKVYSKENELLQDGIFKDGILYDGKEYVYDRDWILLKVKIYKNGFYHSDGQL